jgi:hypothetical protein
MGRRGLPMFGLSADTCKGTCMGLGGSSVFYGGESASAILANGMGPVSFTIYNLFAIFASFIIFVHCMIFTIFVHVTIFINFVLCASRVALLFTV